MASVIQCRRCEKITLARHLAHLVMLLIVSFIGLTLPISLYGQELTTITVQTARVRQTFDGVGVGAIFYEGHITSLAARQKDELQQKLYDDMFSSVATDYLQLMIREIHEPANDNGDPWSPAFDKKNFAYCDHTLQIAKAALKRRPKLQLVATLYTPPPWMKTNGAASGGGEAKATLKDGLELELAEYAWAFLAYMQRNGAPVQYLCIANEPDWPHEQPGYFLTAAKHAALFKTVGEYLDKMSKKYPDVPKPKLVSPNTLSAPGAAKDYVPQTLRVAGKYLDVVASHDYDPRGDRWGALRKVAGNRPVWMTEWCPREKDASPGMIKSGIQYGGAMHDAFTGGVNVWMAYDWVYPPRDSGEALIHVDWGNGYVLTKPYHVFRQWAEPLVPGMHVVETHVAPPRRAEGKAVMPTAFLAADGSKVIVHVVNAQDAPASIVLKVAGKLATATTATRTRTSATEDVAALTELTSVKGGFADELPPQSMVTYSIEAAAKPK
jgi:O-glycosyl hydrolase